VPLSQLLLDASEQLARRERAMASARSAANIDASTKVVIPSAVSMAVA
jgi:hypothetical protein